VRIVDDALFAWRATVFDTAGPKVRFRGILTQHPRQRLLELIPMHPAEDIGRTTMSVRGPVGSAMARTAAMVHVLQRASSIAFAALMMFPLTAGATGGSYFVDDATVTPAGHCQVESWIRWLPRGSFDATSVPACSNDALEFSATLVGRGGPESSHSEGFGVKHVEGDLGKDGSAWGIAANGLLTNGKIAVANLYVPWSVALTDKWVLDLNAGFQRTETPDWHALIGAAVEYEVAPGWNAIGEVLRNGARVRTVQAGVRRAITKDLSLDMVVGQTHDRGAEQWLTLGLNAAW
jgi:hypothetical protein